MIALKKVNITETPQPCFQVYARFKGIRKRARKLEHHMVDLGRHWEAASIVDETNALRPEAIHHFSLEATCIMRKGYRDYAGNYELLFHFETVKRDEGFISTQYEPFGPGHHRITLQA